MEGRQERMKSPDEGRRRGGEHWAGMKIFIADYWRGRSALREKSQKSQINRLPLMVNYA